MASQLLVSVVSVTSLGVGVSVTLSHGLMSGGEGVAPTLVFPDRATPVIVTGVTSTTVTFRNTGTGAETANFRCERGWQPEVDAFSVPPMLWQGGGGGGNAGAAPYLAPNAVPSSQTGSGWSDYEEFEVEAQGPSANLIGSTSIVLRHAPSSIPQQHMVVRNGRIMRVNRDYVLDENEVVLTRVLTDGDVLVVYYNKAVA
jgi:hypothetical protein